MALPTATDLFLEKLARLRRVSGWTAVLVALPVCLATFAHGLVHGAALGAFENVWLDGWSVVLVPSAGTFGALVLLANFALWRMLAWREKTLRRTLSKEALGGAAPTLRVPLFGTRLAPTLVVWQHVIALLFGAALIAWWRTLLNAQPLGGELPAWYTRFTNGDTLAYAAIERDVRLYLAGVHVVLAAACALVATYFASVDAKLAPEARGFAAWLRLATWVLGLAAAHLFAVVFEARFDLEFLVGFLEGLTLLLWIELLLRGVATAWARFYTGAVHPGASVWTDAVVPRLLGTTFNPVKSLFTVAAEGFGIDLRGTWALEYMRRALLPIGALLVLVGWLSTALHVVPFTHVGVLERFGARPASNEGLLEPGLHVVWPWPIDRVRSIELTRVRSLPVGMERPIEGASMLWTEAHAEEEFRLVLGGGDDLLTVNAMLHWRPSDPLAFAYNVANPEQALSEIAERVIFERTASRKLADVLLGNVEVLAREFTDGIRAAVAEANLGIEIVDLAVLALHPPRDVATDYQSVVSAQIEAEKLRIDADAYLLTERIRGAAEGFAVTSDAHGWASEELARASGQISVFGALAGARAAIAQPELFDLVLIVERMNQALQGLSFGVLDNQLELDGATWWYLGNQ
jgi:regulator of protease activity HflC (stomatin/prohibitin superfamily)